MQLAGNRSLDGRLARFRAHSVGCLRYSRHETCPSTTFYPDPSTIPRIPRKPQAVYLRFSSRPYRRGRGMMPKRSRWAGFVAGGPRGRSNGPVKAHGRRAGRRTQTTRAAAWPPPAGRAPRAFSGDSGPIGRTRAAPQKVFLKLSLHRRPSSRIVLLRTGA